MAPKKKTKKASFKRTANQKKTTLHKLALKKKPSRKKLAKKKPVQKRARVKMLKKKRPKGRPAPETAVFLAPGLGRRSGRQSGDLQGLSGTEGADSESVAELLEEGNPFEADAVRGVEEAGTRDEEVHTHEVPEDDVPGEYLDKD